MRKKSKNKASTGLCPWYPSFLRRNPPKHPPSLSELLRVPLAHSSMDLRPWPSAKADKTRFEKITAMGALLLLVTLTISILSLVLAVLAAEIKDAEFVVEGLQKRYDSTLDFVAGFRQETEIKTLNRRLTAWGKVYFRRPGKMLWRYDEPKGQVLLADGEYLYFYQPEEKVEILP